MKTKDKKQILKQLNTGYEFTDFGTKKKSFENSFFEDILSTRTNEDNPDFNNKFMGILSVEAFKDGKRQDMQFLKPNNANWQDDLDLFKIDNGGCNVYATINSMNGLRADKNIQGLNAVYVDIDTTHNVNTDSMTHSEIMASKKAHEDRQYIQKTILNNGIDEILYNNSEKMTINNELLKPNYVEFTGHGFLLVYLFKNQVAVNDKRKASSPIVYKWKHLENYICKQVQRALDLTFNDKNTAGMVDTKATNVTRLMRVPATTNWKSKPIATKIIEYNANRYSFFDLSRVLTPTPKRKRKSAKKSKKSVKQSKKFEAINTNFKGFRVLNIDRVKDMNKLVNYLEGKHVSGNVEGFRETALFYYTILAGAFLKGSELIKEVQHFNILFSAPLTVKEVDRLVNQWTESRAMRLNNAKFRKPIENETGKVEDNGLVKMYAPKNATLLEVFGITPDIEADIGLKTIISPDEKNRRRNTKNRVESATHGAKASRKARDSKIIEMYFNQDMTKAEISKKINVSVSTIKRVVKKHM